MSFAERNNEKVSYKLIERRIIAQVLEDVDVTNIKPKNLQKLVANLAKLGNEVLPVCIARLKTADEEMLSVLTLIIEVLGDEDLIPALLNLLQDGNLPDLNKTTILSILCYFGYDPTGLPLNRMFRDFEAVAKDSLDRLLDDVNHDDGTIPLVLEEFAGFPPEFQLSFVREIASQHDGRAFPLLHLFANSHRPDLVSAAVKGFGDMATPESAAALNQLAQSSDSELRALAVRELIRLRMQGIVPSKAKKRSAKSGALYRVFVSSVDGMGNRGIWMSWRVPGTKTLLNNFNLLINDRLGIRDCWGTAKIKIKECDQLSAEIRSEFFVIEDDLEYALVLIRDALYNNQLSGEPVPVELAYWQQYIGENDLYPEPLNTEISKDLPILQDPELMQKVAKLFNTPYFKDWLLDDENIYQFVEEYHLVKAKTINPKTFLRKVQDLLRKFIVLCSQEKIMAIKNRIILNLDLCRRKNNQSALAQVMEAAIVLFDLIPLWEHPLLQEIFLSTLNLALESGEEV